MNDYTPVELRNGIHYKREDLYRSEKYGTNGAKFRACRHLIGRAVENGARTIVSASSVLSPQAAMAAVVAEEFEVASLTVVGSTRPETAARHVSIRTALAAGTTLDTSTRVAFNPALQRAGREIVDLLGDTAWLLPYGISTPPEATVEDVREFLEIGAPQVDNLPDETQTLVVPFGSGNSAAAILYGLATRSMPMMLDRIQLIGIGPDRLEWLRDRLRSVDVELDELPVDHVSLHGWFASYGDRMPETSDGIVLHPTYEGKVARYLNTLAPDYWTRRDGTTVFWIVGGPL